MPAQPATHPEPAHPADAADPTADVQYYRRVLQKLIDIGVTLLEQLPATPANPASITDAVVAYERLTRAIRKTVVLADSLDRPRRAPRANPVQYRIAARKRIVREAEDLIQRRCVYESDVEDLRVELRERLDGPDIEADILSRPINEIITEICRDLGMAAIPGTQPWARRDPEHIAELCAYAATPPKTDPPKTDPPKTDPPKTRAPEPEPPEPDPAERPEPLETLQLNPTRFRGK